MAPPTLSDPTKSEPDNIKRSDDPRSRRGVMILEQKRIETTFPRVVEISNTDRSRNRRGGGHETRALHSNSACKGVMILVGLDHGTT